MATTAATNRARTASGSTTKTKTATTAKKGQVGKIAWNRQGAKEALNQDELFRFFIEGTGVTMAQMREIWGRWPALLTYEITRGPGRVRLPGIGTFNGMTRKATQTRRGVNPFTKQQTVIKGRPAHLYLKFAVTKSLKEAIENYKLQNR